MKLFFYDIEASRTRDRPTTEIIDTLATAHFIVELLEHATASLA